MDARPAFPDLRSNVNVDHAPYLRNAALSYSNIIVSGLGVVKCARSRTTQHRVQGQSWRTSSRTGDLGAQGRMQAPLQGVIC